MHRHRFLVLATATLAATLAAAPAFNDRPAAAGEWGARPAEGSVCRETPSLSPLLNPPRPPPPCARCPSGRWWWGWARRGCSRR